LERFFKIFEYLSQRQRNFKRSKCIFLGGKGTNVLRQSFFRLKPNFAYKKYIALKSCVFTLSLYLI